jgi:hypothetical protein
LRSICADAELGSLRLHDLRHTVASQVSVTGGTGQRRAMSTFFRRALLGSGGKAIIAKSMGVQRCCAIGIRLALSQSD